MEHMVVEKSDKLIFREIDGEVVIIANDGSHIHMLNETATLIWNCSNKRTSVRQIITEMCEQYDVDEDSASRDVLETIKSLSEKNLIRVCEQ